MRIGVLMMISPDGTEAFVETSVIRWLTTSGAELVYIPPTIHGAEIAAYFEMIDGLFLHQGWPEKNRAYMQLVHTLLTMAEADGQKPVWGSCFGFQSMLRFIGGLDRLERFDQKDRFSKQTGLHLHVDKDESRLLGLATAVQIKHLRNIAKPYFDHEFGISVQRFKRSEQLMSAFKILATSHDRAGKEYVSMIEGVSLPWYGVQFHPEHDPELEWMTKVFTEQ